MTSAFFLVGKYIMTSSSFELINLVIVGLLWGTTNPFLKIGTKGIEEVKGNNKFSKTISEIKFLVTNVKYLVPFLVNQMGSILYYFTLQSSNLTLAVPVTNSLAFIFTAITGLALNEAMPDKSSLIGMGLMTLGIACFIANSLDSAK